MVAVWDVELARQAAKDLQRARAAGLGEKTHRLLETVQRNPFATPPAFGPLQGNLAGLHSRRINLQHRLVYELLREPHGRNDAHYEGTVHILRMWTHFDGLGII